MVIIEDFVYIDYESEPWKTTKGRIIEDTKVPKMFWTETI
jgi:hypothetical protein